MSGEAVPTDPHIEAIAHLAGNAHNEAAEAKAILVGNRTQPGLVARFEGLASSVRHVDDRLSETKASLEHWLGQIDQRIQTIAVSVATRRLHPGVVFLLVLSAFVSTMALTAIAGSTMYLCKAAIEQRAHDQALEQAEK